MCVFVCMCVCVCVRERERERERERIFFDYFITVSNMYFCTMSKYLLLLEGLKEIGLPIELPSFTYLLTYLLT